MHITLKDTFVCLITGIYYFQRDQGDKKFEKFCKIFLSDIPVEELTESGTRRLFFVLVLPCHNRLNLVEVLTECIEQMWQKWKTFQFSGNAF